MYDFEVDQAFLEIVVLVDCQSDRDRSDVVPGYFVFFDEGLVGSATMFGGGGGGEVPFYVGGSADEGHVVEIEYLRSLLRSDFSG